ncbi:MAG: hypothetical protein ACJATA_000769 [Sphingobacteriales bacterium]|jgi:hypothetical protein
MKQQKLDLFEKVKTSPSKEKHLFYLVSFDPGIMKLGQLRSDRIEAEPNFPDDKPADFFNVLPEPTEDEPLNDALFRKTNVQVVKQFLQPNHEFLVAIGKEFPNNFLPLSSWSFVIRSTKSLISVKKRCLKCSKKTIHLQVGRVQPGELSHLGQDQKLILRYWLEKSM